MYLSCRDTFHRQALGAAGAGGHYEHARPQPHRHAAHHRRYPVQSEVPYQRLKSG